MWIQGHRERLLLLTIALWSLVACAVPTTLKTAPRVASLTTDAVTPKAPRGSDKHKALIYVTDGCGGTCVLSYPDGKLVTTLNAGAYYNSGACTDKNGDVFISNYDSVLEYSHGGTTPIAKYELPGDQAKGCAVDQTTGTLAVVFVATYTDIAVFARGRGTPNLYASGLQSFSCAYDGSGNLFIGGYSGQQTALAELPSGGTTFTTISIGNGSVPVPGQVQWHGGYITFESIGRKQTIIYRLVISGSTATIIGKTRVIGPTRAYYSWIYGSRILIPYSTHGPDAQRLGVWQYPQGGKALTNFEHFAGQSPRLQTATISTGT